MLLNLLSGGQTNQLLSPSLAVVRPCTFPLPQPSNQIPAHRRTVHPRLWRWLAVGEGLWGQAIASMVAPGSQEKPLQDELR